MMKNKKQVFGLTQKFYLLLSLLATTIYSIGIWVFTPHSSSYGKKSGSGYYGFSSAFHIGLLSIQKNEGKT